MRNPRSGRAAALCAVAAALYFGAPGVAGAAPLDITGGGTNDVLILDAGAGTYELVSNGVSGGTQSLVGVDSVTFAGGAGNDTLRIINGAGLFAPTGGIDFTGGTGTDGIETTGGSATSGSVAPGVSPDAGVLTHTSGANVQRIDYRGIEAPTLDTVADDAFTIGGTPGEEQIGLGNGAAGADGILRATGDDLLSLDFARKKNVTIEGAGDDDVFTPEVTETATDLETLTVDTGAEPGDSVDLGVISMPSVVVSLTTGGPVRDVNGATTNITAAGVGLRAGTGIGVGDAIELNTPKVEGRSTNGGIDLVDSQAVEVGGVAGALTGLFADESGGVHLVAPAITLTDTDGNETVTAGGDFGDATLESTVGDVTSTVNRDAVGAQSGSVGIISARDITLGTAGASFDDDVRASGPVTLDAVRDVVLDGFADIQSDTAGVTIDGRNVSVSNATGDSASVRANSTGDVTVTTDPGGTMTVTAQDPNAVSSQGGDVIATADHMVIGTNSGVTADNGVAHVKQRTGGNNIDLGSATDASATALELSAAEVDRLHAAIVRVGAGAGTGNVNVSAALTPSGTQILSLLGGSVTQGPAAGIVETNLRATAFTGDVALGAAAGGNDVATLAGGSETGNFSFTDPNAVTVGTVDGASGLDVAPGQTNLTAGGSITQVPGSPVLASAARLQAGGPIALPDSANDLGNVAGTSVGDIRLVAEGIGTGAALRVTTVGLTSGLTAAGGAVSVTNLNNKLFADAPITGAPVTLEADDMDIASGGSVTSAGSDTTLLPRSTGRVLELGRTGDLAGALSLSDAEVDRITADRLFLAPDGRAGNAIFTNGISPAGVPEVHLRTAGLVQDDFVGQDMVTGTFGIESVGGVGVSGTQGALETTVSRIEADTDTGGLAIRNLGAVEIGGVSPDQRGLHVATSGPVTFTNGGPVTLTESGVDPTILAGSAPGDDATLSNTGATSDITDTAPGAAIRAPNGAVSVTAGRDLVLGAAGAGAQDNDVTAARAARLEAGRDVVVGQVANVKSDAESRNTGGDATAVAGRDVTIDGADASLGAEGPNAGQTTVTTGTGGNFTLDSPRVDGLYSKASHVTVNADRAAIDPGAFIRAAAGRITFTPATAGGDVDLGSTGDPVGTLALSSDELDTAFSPLTRVTTTTPAGSQTVSAPVAATHTERLSLNSGSTIDTTGAGAIAVENLVTRSVGATALGGPNDVDNLAGNVSGSGSPYSFTDSDDVTTGAIDEVNDGLSTTDGALTLASGGTMTFGKPANAGSAQLLLDAGDRATQGVTAGTALTGGSTRLEGTGPYELANPSNRTDGVEGSVTRSAEWTGASRTAAAPVGVGALESLDGSLTVHPADDLTVTGATQADPGRVELHTDAADRLLTNSSGITSPDVLLRSDRMALAGGTIDAGTKLATLRSHNPGRPTDVGSATDGAGTLRLSDAELDTVTAGTLSVGDRGAGPLTASAPVEPSSAGELELLSSGGFTRTGSGQLGAPTLSFVDGSATPRTWSVDPAAVGDGTGTPIPYAATDLLTVDAGTGNDAFAFRASPTTAYEVDGKSPTSSPGDSMTYDAEGRPTFPDVLPPDGEIASPGVEPVTFRSIETARVTGSDADSDGLRDASDNCVDTPNPGQEDSDRDGRGDACDTDVDDDGRLNDADNCRTDANPTQSDIDSDGRGDTCDPDMDEDGVVNGTDNCSTKANSDQADLDGDGRGDACDTDRDGDGVLDGADNCVSEPNADQRDTDGNGVGTACDQVERSRNAAGPCENRLRAAPNGGVLTGTLGGDVMFGGRGVDVMRGLAGDDCITGSGADDEIHGDEGSDRLSGEDGYDELYGGAGSDAFLRGGDGNDLLDAGSGNDKLYGGDGNDRLIGGTGSDYLSGGDDADRLVGGPGRNKLFGRAGNDTIEAANGVRETVDCGPGRDRAVADRTDKLISCERVTRKRVSRRG